MNLIPMTHELHSIIPGGQSGTVIRLSWILHHNSLSLRPFPHSIGVLALRLRIFSSSDSVIFRCLGLIQQHRSAFPKFSVGSRGRQAVIP
jgi:hypothetical protein